MEQVLEIHESKISGNGAFATRAYAKGELVHTLSGTPVSKAQIEKLVDDGTVAWDDPLQTGGETFIILDDLSRAINHSCDPNVGARGQGELFALRDIVSGEEITYDYSTVVGNGSAVWHMHCTCGAPHCRGLIGNWQTLPHERREYYVANHACLDFVLAEMASH